MSSVLAATQPQGWENLFACTSCHGKFSFDELSHSEQLCKVMSSLLGYYQDIIKIFYWDIIENIILGHYKEINKIIGATKVIEATIL